MIVTKLDISNFKGIEHIAMTPSQRLNLFT